MSLSRSDTPNNSMVLRGQSSMMSTHNPISWTALLEAVTSRWYE
ncbi:hypothetical protein RchiOBHm_Chr2g0103201 [Rosa chinensis]|uniref:Uncharacterized protein n=1 Tax=Rosa chinensis TaxID=74649 RepID=A0A2P6RMU0_ROSCH|nr:hypothetical protein RchiOBHm_Chr2g0103201 [Rosa chinensis]